MQAHSRTPRTASRAWVSVLLLSACTNAPPRLERHIDPAIWADAFAAQATEPRHAIPEATMLLAIPFLFSEDDRISGDLVSDPVITSGNERDGNIAAGALISLAAGTAVAEAIFGDEAQAIEVLAESVLVTEGVVAGLKEVTHRRRPGKNQNTFGSFPSSHTSVSFTMATFLARRIYDEWEGPAQYAGYLLYLPAAYTGINRIESQSHFPTDVLAGAVLGSIFTNWIYDAHYGSDDGEGIFMPERLQVVPQVGSGWAGISLGFGF